MRDLWSQDIVVASGGDERGAHAIGRGTSRKDSLAGLERLLVRQARREAVDSPGAQPVRIS